METIEDFIDFTAFWSIMKKRNTESPFTTTDQQKKPLLSPVYWFYMHDTMEVGPAFRSLLLNKLALLLQVFKGEGGGPGDFHDLLPSIALTSQYGKSMNLGLYSHAYLLRKAKLFEEQVIEPLKQMDIYSRKAKGGEWEDWLLSPPLSLVLCLLQNVEVSR